MVTATYPIAPAITPLRGGLLNVASVSDDFEWLDGRDLFESFNCLTFQTEADFCAPNAKDLDQGSTWQNGARFAAYGGVVCKAIGLNQDSMLSSVRAAFEAGETVAVERGLMKHRFIEGTAGSDTLWEAPEDITPTGGPVSVNTGIAMLEGHAGSHYIGVPTLHLPRVVASLAGGEDRIVAEGDALRTKLGSKVAAGGGYDYPNTGPSGTEPTEAGEKWLYVTGEVVVGRSEPVIRQVMDHSTNEVFVLAERGYIVAIDCYAAAVRVAL